MDFFIEAYNELRKLVTVLCLADSSVLFLSLCTIKVKLPIGSSLDNLELTNFSCLNRDGSDD